MQQLADSVFIETDYAGINVAAIVTERGVICIDAPSQRHDARHWLSRVQHLSPRGIRFVILTDYQADRLLNVHTYNAPLIAHRHIVEKLQSYDRRNPGSFFQTLTVRYNDATRSIPKKQLNMPELVFSHCLVLHGQRQRITLYSMPGPTAGNICIHLPEERILFSGDTVVVDNHPLLLDTNTGQWLGSLHKLNSLIDDVTVLVPGRNGLTNRRALSTMVDYLQQMRQYIKTLHATSQPRSHCRKYVDKLLPIYENSSVPRDQIAHRIQLSLERVYDEIELEEEDKSVPLI